MAETDAMVRGAHKSSRWIEKRKPTRRPTRRNSKNWHVSSSTVLVTLPVLTVLALCSIQDAATANAWSYPTRPKSVDCDRRRAILAIGTAGSLWTALLLTSDPVQARDEGTEDVSSKGSLTSVGQIPSSNNSPRAPMGALVPATHQRLLLEKAYTLAKQLSESGNNTGNKAVLLEQLRDIFEPPTQSTAKKTAVSMTRRYKLDAQVLERAVSDTLSGATVRAAMNVYTANLRFGESYVLTASPVDRKRLIRQYDGLPDVKQVITADLDLRDLYRNQVQTTIEDIQAEVYRDEPESQELVALVGQAISAMGSWFAPISSDDIRDALQQEEIIPSSSETIALQLPKQTFRGYNWWS